MKKQSIFLIAILILAGLVGVLIFSMDPRSPGGVLTGVMAALTGAAIAVIRSYRKKG